MLLSYSNQVYIVFSDKKGEIKMCPLLKGNTVH